MSRTGSFEAFYIDISQENAEEMIGRNLAQNGLITFDHISSVEELYLFCTKLGSSLVHRDSDEYG